MHVAFFCQHYHTPDCSTAARPYSLVRHLARDHDVTLITTDAWRQRRLTHDFDWVPAGVRLRALKVPYANAMAPRPRMQSYAAYAAGACWHGLHMPRPDVVYATSTPLSAACAAALVARRHGAPWIFEVRDLWPDFPIQMGALRSRGLQRMLRGLERRLYRSAAHVVTASTDMAAHVRRFRARGVTTVEYGTPLDLMERADAAAADALRREHHVEDRHVVLYAGSFGRANAIPTLLEAAARLRGRTDLCFVFAGRGHHARAVARAARRLPHVRHVPPQPLLCALALFRLADLSLVPFIDRPVLAANAPSKLYDSLAAGTPVIVTNAGWTKRLVEAHGCGWHVPPEDAAALAAQIHAALDAPEALRAAGARAERLARARFDRAEHMQRLVALIEGVGRGGASVPAATSICSGRTQINPLPAPQEYLLRSATRYSPCSQGES